MENYFGSIGSRLCLGPLFLAVFRLLKYSLKTVTITVQVKRLEPVAKDETTTRTITTLGILDSWFLFLDSFIDIHFSISLPHLSSFLSPKPHHPHSPSRSSHIVHWIHFVVQLIGEGQHDKSAQVIGHSLLDKIDICPLGNSHVLIQQVLS